jgi:hypothetical protein
MRLEVTSPLRQGSPVDVRVTGAAPNARIALLRTDGGLGAGDCPPILNGGCLDIRPGNTGYRVITTLTANAAGVARLSGRIPMVMPEGAIVSLQAVDAAAVTGSNPVTRVVQGACEDDVFEPDDSYRDATVLAGPAAFESAWSCPRNGDWYAIRANAGQVLSAQAAFDPTEMNLDVQIADTAGATMAEANFVLVAPEYVSVVVPQTGTYYVAVFPRDTTDRAGAGYDLTVELDSPGGCAPDTQEPNNNGTTQARALSAGTLTALSTCTVNDYDWFRVDLVTGQTVTLDLLFDNAEGDIDAWLLPAPTVNDINVFNNNFLVRGITADNDENLTFTASSTGSYYLVVKMYQDGGGARIGNVYDLVTEIL